VNEPLREAILSGQAQLITLSRDSVLQVASITPAVAAITVLADDELTDSELRSIAELSRSGCRLFAFIGARSELVHDRFDELLGQSAGDIAMTTFHVDESAQDTAAMVVNIARGLPSPTILLIDGDRDATQSLRSAINAIA
jgi:hypothetical protein